MEAALVLVGLSGYDWLAILFVIAWVLGLTWLIGR